MVLSGCLKCEVAAGEVLQKGNGGIHAGARPRRAARSARCVCVARRRARGITDQRTYGRRRLAWWDGARDLKDTDARSGGLVSPS
ncbi:hypothetical protein GCM10017674_66190 [Streptomyces gardneri]|uniref:Uncharacterized protein n=1 Tax=Streptomyces gardneri TaxID=66892 RepID=A0A4Y3RJN2_9ACTN|nr:hypothetical protein SGA01_27430 [Streptomyces gardneri]GHH16358.1 hypothetical protein GCM10017674_66190 [Streptomyces gardneri]